MDQNAVYEVLQESTLACSSDCIALSGGLDSSIIAHLLHKRKPRAITVIAGDFASPDLVYSQMAAEHFGISLEIERAGTTRILDAVRDTIGILGNFNDIEIRNSVVIYIAAETARRLGLDGLITGDGADELFAGYRFMLQKSGKELELELARIRRAMHFPSSMIGESLGIKIESPFLSRAVMEIAASVPVQNMTDSRDGRRYGKWILRKAFEKVLPAAITWREKSAMQDGAGTAGLTNLFASIVPGQTFELEKARIRADDGVTVRTPESLHYYTIYKQLFGIPQASDSDRSCPYCKTALMHESAFCKMCGAYPV